MNYKYYKFVGGKYFRTHNEEEFQVVNENNMWEQDDLVFYLFIDPSVDYVEITNEKELEYLKKIPNEYEGEIKK